MYSFGQPCVYGVCPVFLAGKSQNIQSCTIYIYPVLADPAHVFRLYCHKGIQGAPIFCGNDVRDPFATTNSHKAAIPDPYRNDALQ